MTFEQTMLLPAPPAQVWAFVMNVPEVAKCLPGAGEVTELGDERYAVPVKVKVGPIALTLQSEITIVSADPVALKAALRLDAADKRVGGAVKATMTMVLTDSEDGGTAMLVTTDATIMGRMGDFGQPMIRKKADQMLAETAAAMTAALDAKTAA